MAVYNLMYRNSVSVLPDLPTTASLNLNTVQLFKIIVSELYTYIPQRISGDLGLQR